MVLMAIMSLREFGIEFRIPLAGPLSTLKQLNIDLSVRHFSVYRSAVLLANCIKVSLSKISDQLEQDNCFVNVPHLLLILSESLETLSAAFIRLTLS